MRAVYDAENLIDAHLVRGRLASEGIEASVRGEFLAGAMGELPMSGLMAVCVHAPDEARARELLVSWQAERAASPPLEDGVDYESDIDDDAAFLA